MDIISEERAWEIVKEFVDEITKAFQDISAIFVIGSLGGAYYRAGSSDIDLLVIMKWGSLSLTQEVLDRFTERYFKKYSIPKGFGGLLIREEELFPPYKQASDYEFTVEIARLKTQGVFSVRGF